MKELPLITFIKKLGYLKIEKCYRYNGYYLLYKSYYSNKIIILGFKNEYKIEDCIIRNSNMNIYFSIYNSNEEKISGKIKSYLVKEVREFKIRKLFF